MCSGKTIRKNRKIKLSLNCHAPRHFSANVENTPNIHFVHSCKIPWYFCILYQHCICLKEKQLQLGQIKAVYSFSTERSSDTAIEWSVLTEFINFIYIVASCTSGILPLRVPNSRNFVLIQAAQVGSAVPL